MAKPLVAIVGRPNVGKSTFFNKIAGRRISIVEDVPGVTRDRVYADVEWMGRRFSMVDTGGLDMRSEDVLLSQMRRQAEIAMDTADVICFFCDGRTGLTSEDEDVANYLRRTRKPLLLVVNKMDYQGMNDQLYEYYNLGLGDPIAISSTNMLGLGDLLEEIVKRHQTGQPILVGTVNVETSEMLSHLIKLRGVSHEVLNAKNHQKEAEIVAQAGHVGAVTIATNMAGRGTDILLGGNPDFLARRAMRQENYPDEIIEAATGHNENVDQVVLDARKRYRELYEGFKKETDAEHERVMALGGLHIIGTERHESRRIDNQLRGRAGRQGDPGSTQFFISLEDDVMRLFGSERIAPMIEKLGMTEDQPLEAGMLTKQIEAAQKRIEGRNYSIRKSVLQYDDVMNKQRELIYGQRRDILMGHDVRQNIIDMVHKLIDSTAERNFTGEGSFDWSIDDARDYLEKLCLKPGTFDRHADAIKTMDEPEELVKLLYADAEAFYAEREALLSGMGIDMREFERVVLLSAIDHHWMDHIDAMDDLRDGIGLRAYGQRDPVQEYRMESYDMFNDMVHFIREETVRRLYQARVERLPERRRTVNLDAAKAGLQGAENTNGQAKKGGAPTNKAMPGAPGRNQPCPCGSGKKYKHCCGAGK